MISARNLEEAGVQGRHGGSGRLLLSRVSACEGGGGPPLLEIPAIKPIISEQITPQTAIRADSSPGRSAAVSRMWPGTCLCPPRSVHSAHCPTDGYGLYRFQVTNERRRILKIRSFSDLEQ